MLQNRLRTTEKETRALDQQLRARLVASEDVSFQREKAAAEFQVDEERAAALQTQINAVLFEKQRLVDATARKQRLARRFEAWCRESGNALGSGSRKFASSCRRSSCSTRDSETCSPACCCSQTSRPPRED